MINVDDPMVDNARLLLIDPVHMYVAATSMTMSMVYAVYIYIV